MKKYSLFLDLGASGICLNFTNYYFAEKAARHLYLYKEVSGRTVGTIDYIEDHTVSNLIQAPGMPNVVYITNDEIDNGHHRVTLRMFDKYTFVLDAIGDKVSVRYHPDAPVSLMTDDVLQAALQPVLKEIGGFILHGSCVVRDNIAIAIMGASGSGKSTTAFNLTRFGFQCYADDAILVIPDNDILKVWPLTREFSIRPLSFRLFQQQGIQIDDYREDGEKYYFNQDNEKLYGAHLKHICFVEVCGEKETTITPLNPDETLQTLLQEKRHFSFMDRQSARFYSGILAKKVPLPLRACVGTDLNKQGRAFESVITGQILPSVETGSLPDIQDGRKQKMNLIRRAWSNPEQVPLKDIIPLLGDFDLKVFKLAFSFFQTYPAAQIEPLESPVKSAIIPQ